ncbi:N-substituted formamide deformylase [Mycolicibacterium vanbaalenii]|uniref:N-substituted formamide deformylase n=1 Tax=Mycolicibacterium vanbaalenii TaxID=110539 RepID=A0A5S9QR39_MYCVN|nr:amidohydrolase [Mycolicibacterium vanbaalenii]CAA0120880.1 N-substituted formamide deformylase [Mycolicibacterium vanbaalenii]
MGAHTILQAALVITMNPTQPRAEAVVVDAETGTLAAVGSLSQCRAYAPDAPVTDLGSAVLMPGFIQAHDHPVPAAVLCEQPAQWIAPFVGFPTWADVEVLFDRLRRQTPTGHPLLFNGLDRLLLSIPMPDRASLDKYFPDHPVLIFDITGHALYFNSRATALFGWTNATPPPDTPDARWSRRPDGSSGGVGYETQATLMALGAFLPGVVPSPLTNLGAWYSTLARNGFTAVGDLGFISKLRAPMEQLAALPGCPVRYSLYQTTYDPGADAGLDFGELSGMIRRVGYKIWMDGSPSIGTAAISVPYLDSARARIADVPVGTAPGLSVLNYTPDQFLSLIGQFVDKDLQIATHINGDAGIDVVLDGYQQALAAHGLTGTDHRWRLEHFSTPSRQQCARAGELGITASMSPFQSLYWGDLYDGVIFEPSYGARWQPYRDAYDGGVRPTFHNDGYLSPPLPWLNIQNAVTRRSASGAVHGPEQALSLHEALEAHTTNAAWQQKRDHEIGSIEVGKLADLVALNTDPYTVDPARLQETMQVLGTWLSGRRVDLDGFMESVKEVAHRFDQALVGGVRPHQC